MKKRYLLLLLCTISICCSYGQIFRNKNFAIDDNAINQIRTLYLSERYKDCIDTCRLYLGDKFRYLEFNKHPYQHWINNRSFYLFKGIDNMESVAMMSYLGCISAYQYSLNGFSSRSIIDGITWARACVAFYDDYLHIETPQSSSSMEVWAKYIQYAEGAMTATQMANHLLAVNRDDSWFKSQAKWFEKKSESISDVLYSNIAGKEYLFLNYPILKYKAYKITSSYLIKNGNLKLFQDVFAKRIEAFKNLIEDANQNNISSVLIPAELTELKTLLCRTVIENEFCKKAGPNYERFCMENLIKLQDISYSLNKEKPCSHFPNYSLRDIQNSLSETDCAILHFEAPIISGQLYSQHNLGTRFRNYALIITKNQECPDVWVRGQISDSRVNSLYKIKDCYPGAKRFFCVGTPRMSFIDFAGNDSSIVRLHSLSQLLEKHEKESANKEITFIGDLKYLKDDERPSNKPKHKGAFELDNLDGPAIELSLIKALYTNVRSVCGDDATKNIVANEISRSKGILHISTHGMLLKSDKEYDFEDLALKRNIMENSRLALSGYNEAPNSPMSYISGSDVLKIRKIYASTVFLDACLSGHGSVGMSGSVGLAEAFYLIGAKNIICYLESVEDNVATRFSNIFYTELSKGASCHDAFFTAKRKINQNVKVILWE